MISPLDRSFGALTILAEAGGEPMDGKVAVAEVILTRLRLGKWGTTVRGVVLWPLAFSCWNTQDRARRLIALADLSSGAGAICVEAFDMAVMDGSRLTDGATNYLNPVATRAGNKGKLPKWAQDPWQTCAIGRHCFYKLPHP